MEEPKSPSAPFGGTIQLRHLVPAVVILSGVAVGYTALRDNDSTASQALAQANDSYLSVIQDFEATQRVLGVADLAPIAAAESKALERLAATLSGDGAEGAVGAVIEAQSDILGAFGGLDSLSRTELSAWGPQEQALNQAREELIAARAEVLADDVNGAQEVADPAKAIDSVRTVVGETATTVLTRSVLQLLADLGQVGSLADLKAIGQEADAEGAVVDAAREGLIGRNANVVSRAGAALSELAGLASLRPATLSRWTQIRVDLLGTVTALQSADPSVRRLTEAGPTAVANVDSYVARAQAALAAWRQQVEVARQQIEEDLEPVRGYLTVMNGFHRDFLLTSWPLREAIREMRRSVEAGERVRVRDVEEALRPVLRARLDVLGGLETTPMPADLELVHRDLARATRRSAVAVERGIVDLADRNVLGDSEALVAALDALEDQARRSDEDYEFYRAAYRTELTVFVDGIRNRPLPERPRI